MLQRQQTEYRFEQESGEAVMLLVTPAAPPHIPAEVRTWRITRHGLSTYSTCTTEEINSFEAQVGSLGIPVRGKTWMHALNEAVQCAAEPEPVTAHSTDHPQAKLEFEIRTTPDRHTLLFKLGGIRGEIAKGATSIAFVDPNCTIGIKLDEQLDENGEEIVISFLLQNLPADLSLLFQQHKPTLYKDCRAFSIGSPTKWITLGKSDHKPFDPFNL